MIDEIFEVKQYLQGKNISKENIYRICYQMTRYYMEQGNNQEQIRSILQEWAKTNSISLKLDINDVISRAFYKEKDTILVSHVVKINKQDVACINQRFDKKRTKLTALAMLCFAKIHADENGIFRLPTVSLSAWTGLNRKSLTNKYIRELVDFGYMEIFNPHENIVDDQRFIMRPATWYKALYSLHNSGNWILKQNDLRILFSDVFCNA